MRFIALAAIALCILPAPVFAQPAKPTKPSTVTAPMPAPDDRARQWLTLVDDGNYSQAFAEAAPSLRKGSSADAWGAGVAAVRAPLGAMASRDLKAVDLTRSHTAVVHYDSAFAHKAAAVETVTLTFADGGWSVAGYRVQ
jgi:hypothetical protein